MVGLLTLLLQGFAVCVIAGIGYTVYVLTHPPRRTYAHAVARGRPGHPDELPKLPTGQPRPFEQWSLKSRGLELPVWDITGDLTSGNRATDVGPVIVMTHGWGDSRIGALTRAVPLLPMCDRLLMWDLPGHGEAEGRCSMGTHEVDDLLALLQLLAITNQPLVLFGWSLGAGVSIVAATKLGNMLTSTLAGVIAEAPYRVPQTPARNVLKIRKLPFRWNAPPAFWMIGADIGVGPRWAGFDRAEHAAKLKCPLLVIHGHDDRVSPIEDGRAIAEAGRGKLVEIPGAGHHGLWTEPGSLSACVSAVRAFLDSLRGT